MAHKLKVQVEGLREVQIQMEGLARELSSGDLLQQIEKAVEEDLVKVGTGWPTGRVRAALKVTSGGDLSLMITFVSQRGDPSSLKPYFEREFKKNERKYVQILDNYIESNYG